MLANVIQAATDGGWGPPQGPWHDGGPGWWLVFPTLCWVLILSAAGYLFYRRSPRRYRASTARLPGIPTRES